MRILCLHGHTQTGPVFERKTARLQEHIRKAYPDASFYFPTGGIAYKVSDRLDYLDEIQRERSETFKDPDDIDTHAWFRLHEDDPPRGLLESIDRVADMLRTEGPFDGIICFSQGSVVGGMVASLLEGPARRQRFEEYAATYPKAVRYPEPYKDLDHPPFKFGITYGAYMGVDPVFSAFYTNPTIETPFMHFTGEFDPVVPTWMTEAVAKAEIGGSRRRNMMHPGAHAIPIGAKFHEAAVDFIQSMSADVPAYFDLPVDSVDPVPTLAYNDTPDHTPLQTPLMTPSLLPFYAMPVAHEKAMHFKRSSMPRRPRGRRARSSASFSGRRSTSSSNSSVDLQRSTTHIEEVEEPVPVKSHDSNIDSAITVVGSGSPVSSFNAEDWQELMLSDLLNEMLRRQGRPGKFYFVPDPAEETLVLE